VSIMSPSRVIRQVRCWSAICEQRTPRIHSLLYLEHCIIWGAIWSSRFGSVLFPVSFALHSFEVSPPLSFPTYLTFAWIIIWTALDLIAIYPKLLPSIYMYRLQLGHVQGGFVYQRRIGLRITTSMVASAGSCRQLL